MLGNNILKVYVAWQQNMTKRMTHDEGRLQRIIELLHIHNKIG